MDRKLLAVGKKESGQPRGRKPETMGSFRGSSLVVARGVGTVDGAILGGCGVAGMSEESVEDWG